MRGVNRIPEQRKPGSGCLPAIRDLDHATVLALRRSPMHAGLTRVALKVSASADGWLYLLLLPLVVVCRPQQAADLVTTLLAAFSLERCLYLVLKNTFRRNRPPAAIAGFQAVITASDRFSLPSGHTSAAFLCASIVCLSLGWQFLPLFLWASAVGASRVLLGVHFPSDTVLGAALGSSVALLVH